MIRFALLAGCLALSCLPANASEHRQTYTVEGMTTEAFVGGGAALVTKPRWKVAAEIGFVIRDGIVLSSDGPDTGGASMTLIVCKVRRWCAQPRTVPITLTRLPGGARISGRDPKYGAISLTWRRTEPTATVSTGGCFMSQPAGTFRTRVEYSVAGAPSVERSGASLATITGRLGKWRLPVSMCGVMTRDAYASLELSMSGLLR